MSAGTAPIRQVLLKVHSRCNLACDYCYVYTFADQTWRGQPRQMSAETVALAADRIAEHARVHRLPSVHLILHGGEPLLAGVEAIELAVGTIRAALPAGTVLHVGLQTNGLLLDEDFVRMFRRQGIKAGVSLDGGPAANDRHRSFGDGRGSFALVARALALLRRNPDVYSGILATIDVRNDPVQTYTDLAGFGPPKVDFLLPHGNWTTPPPHRPPDSPETPYGDWLIAVFDVWYRATPPRPAVRLFDSLMSLLLGGQGGNEAVGLGPVDLITIETDGSIEQGDVLKTAGPGMAATGLHLATHSFDDALAHAGIKARQQGLAALSVPCRQCPLVKVCGGGHYAHRYREGSGFDNPSVYCADLTALIGHIRDRMLADLRPCPA